MKRKEFNNNRMKIEKKELITFPVYETLNYIKHGFSTRLGGVSKGHLASMNLSFSRGDNPDSVIENYKRICKKLKVSPENLVFSDQVHDTNIHVVTKKDCQGSDLQQKKLIGIDGLITNEPYIVLCTFYADCVPLYFVDTKKHVIGLSHSGWRGTVGNIGGKTVEAMKQNYNSKPEDIISVIGPSICQNCYEVSEDVAESFCAVFEKKDWGRILQKKENQKYLLDLWNANNILLQKAGLLKQNIYVSNICTCCNADWLYSHRASAGKRGNLAAFLSLCDV